MHHTKVVTLSFLAAGLLAVIPSCAMPSPGARPPGGRDAPASRASTAGAPSVVVEADRLERLGDDHALVDHLERHADEARTAVSRARLRLMHARALVRLGRKLSALTVFGRAWHEVEPEVDGVGHDVLVAWADHEMSLGRYDEAVEHYELALGARDTGREGRRELRASLVVACEAAGMSVRAAEHEAELDRAGVERLEATRARLLAGRARRTQRAPYVPVVDTFLPPGVIPMNPALILPGIRAREEWGARAITPDHVPMTPITSITVHHSAMPPPGKWGTVAQLKQIQDIHTQDKGWADVGYHFLIDPSGEIWEGRRLLYQGAHAGGAANIGNVGVCLLGNFESHAVPRPQMQALADLVEALRSHFSVPRAEVRTHREWKATACPGTALHQAVLAYRAGERATLARQ